MLQFKGVGAVTAEPLIKSGLSEGANKPFGPGIIDMPGAAALFANRRSWCEPTETPNQENCQSEQYGSTVRLPSEFFRTSPLAFLV